MESRKEKILLIILKEHIKTGAPVGSGVLVEKYNLDASPATVRNEMAVLEEDGYIIQPHTSAGRVPTEKAYRFYLENLKEKNLSSVEESELKKVLKEANDENFKKAAKIIAQFSGNAVFWAFHKRNLYYTGISNLFQQPEFAEADLIYDISAVIDRLDEIIDEVFDDISFETEILIGKENPFGSFCGTILTKYKVGEFAGVFGIISPMRADYAKNKAIINYVKNLLLNG
jgi:heat-inducible transcriptional repressor